MIIAKVYKWFWRDFLMRREPFTFQFRRMAKKWPLVWIIFPALLIVGYFVFVIYKVKAYKWAWIIGGLALVGFITWLLLHLGGFG
ncbi:hypothetical protein LCGC14_0431440 [marine sediment metagenome]|uniref:Uncharacterized protein n=1 Tax=marine sediment metagenome TaxID=412755 RepID=A0A0F9SUA5_9ZZZZ